MDHTQTDVNIVSGSVGEHVEMLVIEVSIHEHLLQHNKNIADVEGKQSSVVNPVLSRKKKLSSVMEVQHWIRSNDVMTWIFSGSMCGKANKILEAFKLALKWL